MPRGYRCIVLAAFGIALACATPSQGKGQYGNNTSARSETGEVLTNIATTIEKAKPAEQSDPGCDPGKDNRNSDLCAQWKAADAAAESAWWSSAMFWLSLVSTLIGGATLCAAGFAAWYARNAWLESKRNADEAAKAVVQAKRSAEMSKAGLRVARQTAHRDQRPWLKLEAAATLIKITKDDLQIGYSIKCTNIGKTVAHDVDIKATLRIFGDINPIEPIDDVYDDLRGRKLNTGVAIIPSDSGFYSGEIHGTAEDQPWGGKRGDQLTCVVIVSVAYRSDFDNEVHWMEQSFTIGHKGGSFLSGRALRRVYGVQLVDLAVLAYRPGKAT